MPKASPGGFLSIAVLIDPARFGATPHALRDLHAESPADDAAMVGALERLLARKPAAVAVAGDDRFLARALTAHWHHLRDVPMSVSPLIASGDAACVGESLGVEDEVGDAAQALLKAWRRDKLKRVAMPSLRVSCSALPRSEIAFGWGARALFTLWEGSRRSALPGKAGKGAALAELLLRSQDAHAGTILHDGVQVDDDALLVATTQKSWFGLDLGATPGARVRGAATARELAAALARSRAPLGMLRGRADVKALGHLVAEGLDGWVMDGELITPGAPCAVQVRPGPPIPMITA
jgi:hypothetical protein